MTPTENINSKPMFFSELQGLRAVAILIVLFFHLNPAWLPGGYVGVDVFFVISGFVITASLLREIEKTDFIDISLFYIKRIRRLLPVAATVLLFVVLGTIFLLPKSQWPQIGFEVIASSLYFENWALFANATNYLAQEEADSPIVHFWSLSIEEQFYLIWPILIVLALKFSSVQTRQRNLGIILLCIFSTSMMSSIIHTYQSPGQGYFSSFTRVWELALGAILSLISWRPKVVLANSMAILGLVMILISSRYYSETSIFPGYLALLPTFGAAFVILAATTSQKLWTLAPLRWPIMLYTGNISYSLYLWHWPLIVFGLTLMGDNISLWQRLSLCAISFIVAGISTYLLEDPFRKGRYKIKKKSQALILAIICIIVPIAGGSYLLSTKKTNINRAELAEFPGARVLELPNYDIVKNYNPETYRPRPEHARSDLREAYALKCHTNFTSEAIKPCKFNNQENKIHIGLIGDSHAGHWEPALVKACEAQGCRVTSITKGRCPLSETKFSYKNSLYKTCESRHSKLLDYIEKSDFDIIVTSQYRKNKTHHGNSVDDHYQNMVTGLVETWETLENENIPIIVIADTPLLGKNLTKCMEMSESDLEKCTVILSNIKQRKDPLIAAARKYKSVKLINMNSHICPKGNCYPVIGDVLVWRDGNHLTRTYSESLSQALYSEMGLSD